MRNGIGMAILTAAALGGCAPEPAGTPEYLVAQVTPVSETVFAVGVETLNANEYAFARCVAAAHVKSLELASYGELPGAPMRTRFLTVDGKRVVHGRGMLQFTLDPTGEKAKQAAAEAEAARAAAGEDAQAPEAEPAKPPKPTRILVADDQLARCEKDGVPTVATGKVTG